MQRLTVKFELTPGAESDLLIIVKYIKVKSEKTFY